MALRLALSLCSWAISGKVNWAERESVEWDEHPEIHQCDSKIKTKNQGEVGKELTGYKSITDLILVKIKPCGFGTGTWMKMDEK